MEDGYLFNRTESIDDFYEKYQSWESLVKDAYKRVARSPSEFEAISENSLNLGTMLRDIPTISRDRLLKQFRGMVGFDDALAAHSTGAHQFRGVEDALRFSMNKSQLTGVGADPVAIILNRMSIRKDYKGEMVFGSNVPSAKHLRTLTEGLRTGNTITGKKIMVLDTETTGLLHESGVRQISARMFNASDGALDVAGNTLMDKHFKTARMAWGKLAEDGKGLTRMDEFLERQYGVRYSNRLPGEGEDFVEALRPFLKGIVDSDHVAGQNLQFDLEQIFVGLAKTKAFAQNTNGIADLFKEARESLHRPGKIVDTLEMVRAQMPDLDLAKELAFTGKKAPFSLENIMLKTNFVDLLKGDLSEDDFHKVMGMADSKFMHAAEVDTHIESYLLKYLSETGTDGKIRLTKGNLRDAAVRRHILKSYAPTPISKIADISHIDREMFDVLHRNGGIRVMQPGSGKEMKLNMSADSLHEFLNRDNAPFAHFDITPMEQDMWSSRRYLDSDVEAPVENMMFDMGKWRGYTKSEIQGKGFLNKMHDLFKKGERPDERQFSRLQDAYHGAGIPFAGISEPERMVTSAMSVAGTLPSDVHRNLAEFAEAKVAAMSEDLGISRFAAQQSAYISKSGKSISLPLELLRAADINQDIEMVGLSPYATHSGKKAVNLMYQFDDPANIDKLTGFLKGKGLFDPLGGDMGNRTLASLGFTQSKLQRIIGALPEVASQYGVAVGYLNGEAGELGYSVLESLNQGMTADRSGMAMRAVLTSDTTNKTLRTGAFVQDRFLDDPASRYTRAHLKAETEHAMRAAERFERMAASDSAAERHIFRAAASAVDKGTSGGVARNALKIAETATRHLPLVGGVAIAAASGYYFNKKRTQQNVYDETLERQNYQTSSAYSSYRQEMGLPGAPAYRTKPLDPMAYAGVTGNLDRNKIGHELMGKDKYSNLFGGTI